MQSFYQNLAYGIRVTNPSPQWYLLKSLVNQVEEKKAYKQGYD